jgi:NADH-quinone oxidoreductase subunit A
MAKWALIPPVAFLVIFTSTLILSGVLSLLSFKGKKSEGTGKAYACGEEDLGHRPRVDYSQFFPFAFFFTILHVTALMVATIPAETIDSFFIAVLYMVGALTGLVVLFRR